tara:strand:- start:5 stop:268 length:264 start_codon:yes stop_codon:yes gene_type:complete
MIDTDKYEGHDTDKRMKLLFRDNLLHIGNELSDADYHLLVDAPLLLAEVKRLSKGIKQMADIWLDNYDMDGREKLIKMTNQLRELIE